MQRHAWYMRLLNLVFAMSPAQGALPTLRATTAPDVKGGDYFGPHGFQEMRGHPGRVGTTEAAKNAEDAARLWPVSEELSGVRYGRPADTTTAPVGG